MANSYSAGNLNLQINAVSDKATASLGLVNSKLQTMMSLVGNTLTQFKGLQNSLSSISRLQFNSISKLANGLNSIGGANLSSFGNQIKGLATALEPLKTISIDNLGGLNSFANGLNKIVKIDVATFDKNIQSLTNSLKPFLAEITQATPALTSFANAMQAIKGKRMINFNQISGGGGSFSTLRIGSLVGKLYFLKNITQRYFQAIAKGLKTAIDYTETLNLWQVAMGKNRVEAEKFIGTMNKAYGISEQTLMNYQAIFRNMLSSLGGVSGDTTYKLSEYLTQMALDYASLYNTTIQKAMTTFQSVLSGQVRPIRSIAGYDITETTIYQLYQTLGGTKTQRQLSQTEKRMLRIYAVFQQMDRSGAIGDLRKTIENTANQLRIMSETLKEVGQWLGVLLETAIRPLLPQINAFLMVTRDVIKALAFASGYEPFEGGIEQVEEFNEELDKTQNKLLSFDKFEALNSNADDSSLGIDTAILDGLQQYESILGNVEMQATELYKKWREWWFEIDEETGKEKLSTRATILTKALEGLGIALGALALMNIPNILAKIGSGLGIITNKSYLLNAFLVSGIIMSIKEAIDAFKKGDYWAGILATAIGVTLFGAFIKLNQQAIIKTATALKDTLVSAIKIVISGVQNLIKVAKAIDWALQGLGTSLLRVSIGLGAIGASIGLIVGLVQNWDSLTTIEKVIGVLGVLTTALFGAAIALGAFHSAWSIGLAAAAIIAGIAATTAIISKAQSRAQQNIQYRKNGGALEDGLFTMSKGEIIGNFDDGTTVVANNQQVIAGIKQGVYEAVSSAMSGYNGGGSGNVYLDGRKVGIATAQSSRREQVRVGLTRVSR